MNYVVSRFSRENSPMIVESDLSDAIMMVGLFDVVAIFLINILFWISSWVFNPVTCLCLCCHVCICACLLLFNGLMTWWNFCILDGIRMISSSKQIKEYEISDWCYFTKHEKKKNIKGGCPNRTIW